MNMIGFKHIVRLTVVLIATLCTVSCNETRTIPDSDLVNIFHDAMLANAYLSEKGIRDDSLLVYGPILEKYGYTEEEMRYTIKSFSERKSAKLSDLVVAASKRLEQEAKAESYKIVVLDTVENIARRSYTRTIYSDSLIRAKRMRDTSDLRVYIDDLVPGEYNISFNYHIDSLDENRNSRVEIYMLRKDSNQVGRHTTMLSRNREDKYSRKIQIDSTHRAIYINMYYHPRSEKSEKPDITITDFKVVRVLPKSVSLDSLYNKQLGIQIFNDELMCGFTTDTIMHEVTPINPADTLRRYEENHCFARHIISEEEYGQKNCFALHLD